MHRKYPLVHALNLCIWVSRQMKFMYFGMRPNIYKSKFQYFYKLLEQGNKEEANKILEDFKNSYINENEDIDSFEKHSNHSL